MNSNVNEEFFKSDKRAEELYEQLSPIEKSLLQRLRNMMKINPEAPQFKQEITLLKQKAGVS